MTAAVSLAGLRIVVSAGPTFEDIDPVRFIGNRSSGKMGFAIAAAAARRGAQVVLVAGPVHLDTPASVQRIDVRSATQLRDAVIAALPADVYIGAAAVADYAPRAIAGNKIKKSADILTLELVRTPDTLAEVSASPSRPRCVVGFAAETENIEAHARGKLQKKNLDLIAANRVGVAGSGFESDDNALTVYSRDGVQALGPAPKTQLADELLTLIAERLHA
ncbi:phosphopantothenoylcysteine decarboxylase/phosphopantothenate--cysteine ligase [Luteimonas cucumeris]|uniref:Phosphopantothenoylcysteine decarboxylase/phosphopantothenate--cysteine ligase n=1 Tax=Luteimonas cucumeris TaxID=985012 RepID=A0A562LDW3_9GAMM|nr:phosphopantothenoylcysteine decarboxylase/phosphopantothenate--cysteine ligase [Luteimonas cucumeris]